MTRYQDEKDGRREAIRYVQSLIYGEEEGKKAVNTLLPKYLKEGKTSGFVALYNIGFRVGDAAPKVMLKLL